MSRLNSPNQDPSLDPLRNPGRSLAAELASTADDIRQLYTDAGLRPYRVFMVVEHWSGGQVGRGKVHTTETELLPTPKVNVKGSYDGLTAAGRQPKGSVMITEISARYTEDEIVGLFTPPAKPDQVTFLEVSVDARDGKTRRRRYTIKNAPQLDAENFQWTAVGVSQSSERTRDGKVTGPRLIHGR